MMTNALTEGTQVFLETSYTIRSGGASQGSSSSSFGKLQGRHEWPFSFPFPTEFEAPQRGGSNQTYTTPQTVVERGINGNVMYEVVVKIVSGLLRTKDRYIYPTFMSLRWLMQREQNNRQRVVCTGHQGSTPSSFARERLPLWNLLGWTRRRSIRLARTCTAQAQHQRQGETVPSG
jgi:hypothetical protein